MARLSRYFANLRSSYNAELDDLRTDSEGNNVLKARLAKKREQLPQVLMMMQFAPEMVAVAFHGGFAFKNAATMESLVTREPNKFPSWATLTQAISIEPWAQTLVKIVLADPDGERFLITTAALEYLNRDRRSHATPDAVQLEQEDEATEENQETHHASNQHVSDEDDEAGYDLDEAGADWLAEQGFDRKE